MTNHRDVPIEVVNRHGHVSSRMEEYALRKVERLLRFDSRITRIEVVVDGPHEEPVVECLVHVDRQPPVVARAQGEHFSAAVDEAVEKAERQIKRAKEKRTKHKGEGSLRDVAPPPEPGERPDDR